MRFLFLTTGSHVTVYAIAALAHAVRNAGHDVLVATNEPLIDAVETVGLPGVSITSESIRHFLATVDSADEMVVTGRGLGRMASATLVRLGELAQDWAPDVIVGSSMSYAAGLLAATQGIPFVRHIEYLQIPMAEIDPVAEEELTPELTRRGLGGLPEPDLLIDVSPPSLRSPPAAGVHPMRYVATNPQRRLQRWAYTRPQGRPRVLITSGTHHRMLAGHSLRRLAEQLTAVDAEVVIAAPTRVAEEFGSTADDIRIGWVPLDTVAPTCDLAVHHGGATTTMAIIAAGVPQVITPPNTHTRAIADALSDFGAAATIRASDQADHELPDVLATSSRELLADSRYTRQAQALAAELATLPTPADIVRTMETLACTRRECRQSE
ncbi:glycosyltransferase [Salinispora tropica]|uniref:Erythromycin biosynthesis protein CIII-like central domain-containing protein n=1 Tax=Salinispora tropica (strain ATCC BAA-916 / DSM 44818 / JCM 13857 / NBRC 105044 / CNB-440) TaxID=369723 RepID=A4X714_SALTO|nr:nucleotide disphospho-sugar-binding domain-containing protein [Salinispora tropica]ABP54664.1 protein of unknown function DUF1205 [Salinispora tropica CNB-440]